MMLDQYVVDSVLKYLDQCSASGQQASLVDMWEFVDYYLRAHLPAAAVNEALRRRPNLFVHRIDGRVFFNHGEGDREVTKDDIQKNWEIYHAEFWAKYQQMQDRTD